MLVTDVVEIVCILACGLSKFVKGDFGPKGGKPEPPPLRARVGVIAAIF